MLSHKELSDSGALVVRGDILGLTEQQELEEVPR